MIDKLIKVLIIDDDQEDFILTKSYLEDVEFQHYLIDWAPSFERAVATFSTEIYDVYLVDFILGKNTGIDLVQTARNAGINKPFIMLTGKGATEIDKQAMRAGISDYLIKGNITSDSLERSIRYAVEHSIQLATIAQKEKKFRDIFEKSSEIILLTDNVGNIIDANPFAITKFRKSKDDLIQKNIIELVVPQERTLFWELVMLRKLEGIEFSFLIIGHNNLIGLISFIEQDDASFQFIIHDVTTIRNREKQFRETEKFAATGRVARYIAHEVKNPLTNVNFAVSELKEEIKEEQSQFLFDVIERNCERINKLVTELLTSTRFAKLNLVEVDINQIIEETLLLANDSINQKKITIAKTFDELMPVFADDEKIKLAFMNILVNAIEAIEVTNGHIAISTKSSDNKLIISFTDNGKGIPKEHLNKLFEAFYTNGKINGTGLGLTNTQNVILNHNGHISVDSEIGIGTTFTIILYPEELKQLKGMEEIH